MTTKEIDRSHTQVVWFVLGFTAAILLDGAVTLALLFDWLS